MTKEIWKGMIYQGQDYSWRFEVSNTGKIRNKSNKHEYLLHKGGIGYLQICTSIDGVRKNIKAHKAVAETFIENPFNKPFVNHIDGNKLNNNVSNLEWVTRQENTIHAKEHGLLEGQRQFGIKNPRCKLTDEQVMQIRELYQHGSSIRYLAKTFNVSERHIHDIVKYRYRIHAMAS